MQENLQEKFIKKLIERYGEWEKVTSKFGKSSFGEIADELCISNSHLSKLITGNATEGMYTRSIKNIDRLIRYENQIKDLTEKNQAREEQEGPSQEGTATSSPTAWNKKQVPSYNFLLIFSGLLIAAFGFLLVSKTGFTSVDSKQNSLSNQFAKHPLSLYFDGDFESDYVSPYLNDIEVQNYCPCSAYEGAWALDKEYIIPLPGRIPGLYYIAKSADVRMKCHRGASGDNKGQKLLAFENIQNELWVDRKRRPLSPKFFNAETKTYTQEFHDLDFENDPDFVKVADIYSCFFNEFTITPDTIFRKGEPCGRYANVTDPKVAKEFEIDLQQFLENVIGSMTATRCAPCINPYCDPNDLEENVSTLSFDCFFAIQAENLGLGGGYPYSKTYKLIDQHYAANLLCNCESRTQAK